jgi:Putative transposase of IS4/5 family (DUF4096)
MRSGSSWRRCCRRSAPDGPAAQGPPADRGSNRVAGPHRRAWRDLPGEFGPWATVASRFYRWRRQGVWDRVLQALQADADARGELNWPAEPMTLGSVGLDLPAIRQQQGLTTPHAAPCHFDAIRLLSSVDMR